ncbi:MAG: hypothetical protein QOJ65_1206 [Fimbriimonadaceae bacterium]|jgi:hypothetical protein|nr:hypothetical protein [Fimbriimonadaceae bacterium]
MEPETGARTEPDFNRYKSLMRDQYTLPGSVLATMRSDLWSWLAVPIIRETTHEVVAVMFFDSNDQEFFRELKDDEPGPSRIEQVALLVAGTIGDQILAYLERVGAA